MGRKSKRAQIIQQQYLEKKKQKEIISEPSLRQRLSHQSWCFKNNIFIWLEPISWRGGIIVVNYKGDILRGNEIYVLYNRKPKDVKWSDIIWKLYTKYYNEEN